MVRAWAVVCALCLAGAASAQDSVPPVVTSEASVPGDGSTVGGAETALSGTYDLPEALHANASGPVETKLVGLVAKAHWVVQAVMAALALGFAAVLAVFLFKSVEFALAFARLRRAHRTVAAEPGLVALSGTCPLALTSQAVRDEAAQLPTVLSADLRAAVRERLDLRLDRIEAGAIRRLRSGSGLLASIGSVGPFIGLFGTVFGIMNSFLAIAETKTTNLSVVAPGIAEALLATGIGLVAAIPAVLLYNVVVRRVAAFRHALADARTELLLRFSRELDAHMREG